MTSNPMLVLLGIADSLGMLRGGQMLSDQATKRLAIWVTTRQSQLSLQTFRQSQSYLYLSSCFVQHKQRTLVSCQTCTECLLTKLWDRRRLVLLNAPSFFSLLWRICEPIMPGSTRDKVKVVRSHQVIIGRHSTCIACTSFLLKKPTITMCYKSALAFYCQGTHLPMVQCCLAVPSYLIC